VMQLNKASIVPILSLDNRLEASQEQLSGISMPCAQSEDALLKELEGLTWVRFYETWPQSFFVPTGADLAAAMVQNAILEGKKGVPVALHAGGGCPAPSRTIVRPGRLGGDIEFVVASYLIVQDPLLGSTLSISNDWYDADFCWRPEWDVDFGMAIGEAVRLTPHTWARNYSKAIVFLDVSSNRGEVQLLGDPPRPGWSEPIYCTSCARTPMLKDLGTNFDSVKTCQVACEKEPQCAYINYAMSSDHHCILFAACDDPWTISSQECGGPHGWWTTFNFTRPALVV